MGKLAGIVAVIALALVGFATSAQAAISNFAYTGGEQAFVVPSGVSSIHVLAVGGSGGEGDLSGGAAAQVSADLAVTPGQTLYIEVGGIGQDSGEGGAGGFNGGAAGGSASGGGGGGSDVRRLPFSSGLISDTRLIVAAGGGGGGGPGIDCGGAGGAAGSPGENSCSWFGGGAGTESAGGVGGEGCFEFAESGQLGLGGIGGFGESGNNGGGGGGGGNYGGGGGGGGCSSGGGGGGGGSSLVPAGGTLVTALGSAAPQIQISYTPPVIAPQPSAPAPAPVVAHCVVPKVKGKTLKAAKKKLRAANCRLGSVTKEKSVTAATGKVVKQGPKPGKVLAAGAKVRVKLG
jgi:hypothetical protein